VNEIDLTLYKSLVEQEKVADLARIRAEKDAEAAKRVRDQIREQLEKLMGPGDGEALVDGVSMLKKTVSGQFAHARFKTNHPDLYDQVKTYDYVEKADTEQLRIIAPDIYAQYLTTRWTNSIEVADV